jgi:RNA polymerase sigma factor (sigma-70 family)
MLLKLQNSDLLAKLSTIDAPAKYLARMMENSLRNQNKHKRRARRAAPRYAAQVKSPDADRPDNKAEHNELCAKVRYTVNHILRANERKILWWFYKDGLTVRGISGLLQVSEAAVLQRLSRARKRLREAFDK